MKVKIEVDFNLSLKIPLKDDEIKQAAKWFTKTITDNIQDTVHRSRHPFVIDSNVDVNVNIAYNTIRPVSFNFPLDGEMPKQWDEAE